MKFKGIRRKIDKSGRVVIPRQIRDDLDLQAGDNLYFTFRNGEVIISKESSPKEKDTLEDISEDTLDEMEDMLEALEDGIKEMSEDVLEEKIKGLSLRHRDTYSKEIVKL